MGKEAPAELRRRLASVLGGLRALDGTQVGDDALRHPRQDRGRQIVAHAIDDLDRGAGNSALQIVGSGYRYKRVRRAMDDQGWRPDARKQRQATRRADDGSHLTTESRRIVAAIELSSRASTQIVHGDRKAWAADAPEEVGHMLDSGGAIVGRGPTQKAHPKIKARPGQTQVTA